MIGRILDDPWRVVQIYAALLALLVAVLATLHLATTADRWSNDGRPVVVEATAERDCDMHEEIVRTVHELGDDLQNWRRSPATRGHWGYVSFDLGYARIHPDMPCEHVADVVKHEWIHLQQARMYGDRDAVYARYGHFELERVASCGAILLGSRPWFYVDPRRPMHGDQCSLLDIFEAVRLISFTPAVT